MRPRGFASISMTKASFEPARGAAFGGAGLGLRADLASAASWRGREDRGGGACISSAARSRDSSFLRCLLDADGVAAGAGDDQTGVSSIADLAPDRHAGLGAHLSHQFAVDEAGRGLCRRRFVHRRGKGRRAVIARGRLREQYQLRIRELRQLLLLRLRQPPLSPAMTPPWPHGQRG